MAMSAMVYPEGTSEVPRQPPPIQILPTFTGPRPEDMSQAPPPVASPPAAAQALGDLRRDSDKSEGKMTQHSSGSSGQRNSLSESVVSTSLGSYASAKSLDKRNVHFHRTIDDVSERVEARLYGLISTTHPTPNSGASTLMLAIDHTLHALVAIQDTELLQGVQKSEVRAVKDTIRLLAELPQHDKVLNYYSVDILKRKLQRHRGVIQTSTSTLNNPLDMSGNGLVQKEFQPHLPHPHQQQQQQQQLQQLSSLSASSTSDQMLSGSSGGLSSSTIASPLQGREKSLVVFMEYVPGASLSAILKAFGGELGGPVAVARCASTLLAQNIIRQILLGLQHLHSYDMVHADLCSDHVLITLEGNIKLIGMSGTALYDTVYHGQHDHVKRLRYMAPEAQALYRVGKMLVTVDTPADVWSVGCIAFELLTSQQPFPMARETAELIATSSSKKWIQIEKALGPLFLQLSEPAKDFIKCCLQRRPEKRSTVESLLDHPFLIPEETTNSNVGGRTSSSSSLQNGSFSRVSNGHSHTATPVGAAQPTFFTGSNNVARSREGSMILDNDLLMEDIDEAQTMVPVEMMGGSSGTNPQFRQARRLSIGEGDIQRFIFNKLMGHVTDIRSSETAITSQSVDGNVQDLEALDDKITPMFARSQELDPNSWEAFDQSVPYGKKDEAACLKLIGRCDDHDAAARAALEEQQQQAGMSPDGMAVISIDDTDDDSSTATVTRSVGAVRFSTETPRATAHIIPKRKGGRSSKPSNSPREFFMTYLCCCLDDPGQLREMRRRRRRRNRFMYRLIGTPLIVALLIGIAILLIFLFVVQ